MSDKNWFEEKPSRELQSRIEHMADRELDRRSRLAQKERRRMLNFAWLMPISMAALVGIWFSLRSKTADQNEGAIADLELLSIEEDEFELLASGNADEEFFDDLDLLEEMTDEDFNV